MVFFVIITKDKDPFRQTIMQITKFQHPFPLSWVLYNTWMASLVLYQIKYALLLTFICC